MGRLFVFAAIACAGVVGCVGDSTVTPDAGPDATADAGADVDLTGTAGHPCFGNGTCDQGLVCLSSVCVSLGNDGGTDATSDAADGSCNIPQPYSMLDNNCVSGKVTCLGSSGFTCDTAANCTTSGGKTVTCAAKSSPACSGNLCCLDQTVALTGTCPVGATPGSASAITVCGTASGCPAGDVQVCSADADCGGSKKCVAAQFNTTTGFGICN